MDHALDSGIGGVCVSRMSKKYKEKVCAYCAESGSETADHVVAREFFPRQYRDGLPKAPACKQCQGEKSRLENVFIAVLPFGSEHPLAVATLTEKGRRRLDKNAALRKKLEAGLAPLLVEHEGLVLPSVSLPLEGEQFIRLWAYIVRGLVWHEWKYVVPHGYCVEVLTLLDSGLDLFRQFLRMGPEHRRLGTFAEGAFEYTCTRNGADPAFSIWHIRLYGGVNIAGVTDRGRLAPLNICALTGPPEVKPLVERFRQLRV
jgi:hypothetical protein